MIHGDKSDDSIEKTYFLDKKEMLLFTVVEHHYVNFIVVPSFINNRKCGKRQPDKETILNQNQYRK